MNEMLRRSWIHLLGTLFMVCAFIYLLKYTWSQSWVSEPLKIGLGLLVGAAGLIAGFKLLGRRRLAGELSAGLGVAVLYTTFAFAGIYFALWDSLTVFLCMLALTLGMSFLSYKLQLRLLMNLGLLGGLAAPMILRPETDQVFTLFLYLLVLNTAYFLISIRKQWTELRLTAFIGTWLLYAIYYVQFHPVSAGYWSLPFRYALSAFAFYVLALLLSSWACAKKFDGLNLYLGIVNAVIFGLWASAILDPSVSFAYPLGLMGLLYVLLALIVHRLEGAFTVLVLTKLFGGLLLLLIASVQFGKGWDIKPLVNVLLWLAVASGLLIAGKLRRLDTLRAAAAVIWLAVGCYWFATTWDTPWGIWFGVYLPFLNWAAFAWELLAAMGFYLSLHTDFARLREDDRRILSIAQSLLSHLVVGGLLTLQMLNLIEYYRLGRWLDANLTLSLSWGVYALLLFLWGAYSRQQVYRAFGSIVLLCVAVKTLLFDLYGSETIYKIIVLFALGLLSYGIAYINSRWQRKRAPEPLTGSEANEMSQE